MQSNVTINANGQIPLAQSDIAVIPSIAYTIPDFEGQAILRIFSNTTQSEIACYSAVVTNGATFSQPEAVGSILGVFAFIAMFASFMTAIYGSDIPTMRTHYAHSLSVLVVFAVFQHIYFTGALSMNWPSVLPAFWSNYAWSAGIINSKSMQDAFDKLTGNDRGNTSMLGAAGSGTWASNVGGGFDIHTLYKRSRDLNTPQLIERAENMLYKRATGSNSTAQTKYQGHLVRDGLPLPGNYSGFPGTLYVEEVPASNAFLTALVWFLILILAIGAAVIGFKLAVESLANMGKLRTQRLDYFRSHYLSYTALALLRTCFIGFFAMMFYTLFQFSYGGVTAVMAIAGVVFAIFFIGIFGLVGYACYFKLRFDNWGSIRGRYEETRVFKVIPWYHRKDPLVSAVPVGADLSPAEEKKLGMDGKLAVSNDQLSATNSAPNKAWQVNPHAERSVHDDEEFTKKFGWLASRFRKSKWWFFAAWVVYEFVRACFFAGASGHAMVQVFGLLVVEFLALMFIIIIRPFEGQRLNVVMVYLLGFSKVATVALSAAFDVTFNLGRIVTTAIGIVIIVIQGLLTIALMVCIVLSAITSYFSIMRYREEIKPKGWNKYRERYFKHLNQRVKDRPATPPPVLPTPPPEEPKGPYFSINSVRRAPKIEDEDAEFQADILRDPRESMDPAMSRSSMHLNDVSRSSMNLNDISRTSLSHEEKNYAQPEGSRTRDSRTMSMSSRRSMSGLPYAARVHRGSWSTRDFNEYLESVQAGESEGLTSKTPVGESETPSRPLSRMVSPRASHDSITRPSLSEYAPAATRSRSASMNLTEQLNRQQDGVSPLVSPVVSRSNSLRGGPSNSAIFGSESPVKSDDTRRPLSPINTAIARGIDTANSPPPSPGSPRRTRSKLQRHKRGDSINEE